MTRAVVFRPQAEDDLRDVRDWYDRRRQGIGQEFGEKLDGRIARIITGLRRGRLPDIPEPDLTPRP